MESKLNKANIILVAGLTGIICAFLTFVSDAILLGRPVSSEIFFRLGTESMTDLSQWRMTLGTFAGIIILPLQTLGLVSVFFGLRPAGRLITHAAVFLAAHALIMGVAFHTSYMFIGSGWKLHHGMSLDNILSLDMIKTFDHYWKLIIIIIFAEVLASSILFSAAILSGKTLYPKWMAFFNPICVLLLLYPLIYALPAPIGGYIAPGYLNLATMTFLILSTAVIYKRVI